MEQRSAPVVSLRGLVRSFHQGSREIHVLRGAFAEIYPGETVALVGPSGAGKSSLLHLIGLLEQPNDGSIIIGGKDVASMTEKERTRMRRSHIGFIYQFHQLLPEFTATENIVIPQLIAGLDRAEAETRAGQLLSMMGLSDRGDHLPAEMSGGEQQRVAIARAVANNPALLLADEPTGSLDPETGERVFHSLLDLVRNTGLAALIATHNMELASRMDRVLALQNGELVESQFQRV